MLLVNLNYVIGNPAEQIDTVVYLDLSNSSNFVLMKENMDNQSRSSWNETWTIPDLWTKYINVTITNPDTTNHLEEVVDIIFNHQGYADYNNNCSDIRVLNNNGDEIDRTTNQTSIDNILYNNITFVCNSTHAETMFTVNVPASSSVNYSIYFNNTGVGEPSLSDYPYIIREDFETDAVGSIPSHWTLYDNPDYSNVSDVRAKSGLRSLNINETSSASCGLSRFTFPSKNMSYELDFYITQTQDYGNARFVRNSTPDTYIQIIRSLEGQYKYSDGSGYITVHSDFSLDVWHRQRLILVDGNITVHYDYSTSTTTLNTTYTTGGTVVAPSWLALIMYGHTTFGTNSGFYDNVNITSGKLYSKVSTYSLSDIYENKNKTFWIEIPKNSQIIGTENKLDLTAYPYNTIFPSNVTLIVGSSSNPPIFNHTGNHTTTNRTDDFSLNLTNYLSTCTANVNETCNVPFILHSDTIGTEQISAINITYDYNISSLYALEPWKWENVTVGSATNMTRDLTGVGNVSANFNITNIYFNETDTILRSNCYFDNSTNSYSGTVGTNNCSLNINFTKSQSFSNWTFKEAMTPVNEYSIPAGTCDAGYTWYVTHCYRVVSSTGKDTHYYYSYANATTNLSKGNAIKYPIPKSRLPSFGSKISYTYNVNDSTTDLSNTEDSNYFNVIVGTSYSDSSLYKGLWKFYIEYEVSTATGGGSGGGGGGGGFIPTKLMQMSLVAQSSLSITQGETKTITATVTNIGQADLTGIIVNASGDFITNVDPILISKLAPGESKTITVTLTAPEDAEIGTKIITIIVNTGSVIAMAQTSVDVNAKLIEPVPTNVTPPTTQTGPVGYIIGITKNPYAVGGITLILLAVLIILYYKRKGNLKTEIKTEDKIQIEPEIKEEPKGEELPKEDVSEKAEEPEKEEEPSSDFTV